MHRATCIFVRAGLQACAYFQRCTGYEVDELAISRSVTDLIDSIAVAVQPVLY